MTELRPETTALHGAAGVTQDTVRLSVGIEHVDDILGDLNQALARVVVPVAV